MLHVNNLSVLHFKNYTNRSFSFSERVIGICGKNGVGKTNLLDAIHYLSFTKSYFTRQDAGNVLHKQNGFRIEADITLSNEKEKTVCVLRETGKKEFSVNGQLYQKFSLHIGRYPLVIIAPDDSSIIVNGSEERRRFIDMLLCQLDAGYMENLSIYSKVLQQRNSLLKSFAETSTKNLALLDVLDEQLLKPGEIIFEKRKLFLTAFLPTVKRLYTVIAQQYEEVNLFYNSQLHTDPFAELLNAYRQKDLAAQRTTAGVHKDDIELEFNGQPFKTIASQGQRKSLLFALKLAEMEVLQKEKGFAPLLLLDDVFEKLDEERISNLLQMVCVENEGQVFITDTNEERLKKHLEVLEVEFQVIGL